MTVVAISHAENDLPRFFHPDDLARLRAATTVRVLGSNHAGVIAPQLGDVDILLSSWGMPKLDSDLLKAAPRLRAACYAAGSVKGFVTPESYARKVLITTAMHANAVPVAQVTLALITLANKAWFHCLDTIRGGGKDAFKTARESAHPGNYRATTVGIIGFGAIGRMVVEGCRALELRVLVYDPYADPAVVRAAGAEPVSLLACAKQGHVLSLHAPNIPACEGMINAEIFRAMPDGATFINTARGKLVDESALIAELQTGRISAHLDVTYPEPPVADSPLWALPNCYLTPHRAGSSSGEIQRMGSLAIDECLAVHEGRPAKYPVTEAMLATMA
jgi:phosphoglycerate dehydrogenase-like enzyme